LVPLTLVLSPKAWRRRLALEFTSISPHYFVQQDSHRYDGLSRREGLEAELTRNLETRREICEKIVRPHLNSDSAVIDFGCGPGFLAAEIGKHCRTVVGVDVSRGVVACARILSARQPNAEFRVVQDGRLDWAPPGSVDLVCTFAVLQHVPDLAMERILAEFLRVLKPGGLAICHIAAGSASSVGNSGGLGRFALLMITRTVESILEAARRVGFEADAVPVRDVGEIDDDIGRDYLFRLRKPPAPGTVGA